MCDVKPQRSEYKKEEMKTAIIDLYGHTIKIIDWDHLRLVDLVWLIKNRKHLPGIIKEL